MTSRPLITFCLAVGFSCALAKDNGPRYPWKNETFSYGQAFMCVAQIVGYKQAISAKDDGVTYADYVASLNKSDIDSNRQTMSRIADIAYNVDPNLQLVNILYECGNNSKTEK